MDTTWVKAEPVKRHGRVYLTADTRRAKRRAAVKHFLAETWSLVDDVLVATGAFALTVVAVAALVAGAAFLFL